MEFFDQVGIDILDWPAYSLDINLMENIWSMLSDYVYDGFQPKNVGELKKRINDGVLFLNESKSTIISNLFDNMAERCINVCCARGKKIHC